MPRRLTVGCLPLLALLAAPRARAALVVPSIFSDGCVLQTNAEYGARSYVFGYAAAGDAVRVALVSGGATLQNLSTAAGAGGAWSVTLNPLSVSTPPFDIVVADETTGERHVAAGCVVGDVYVCSGQSNQCFSAESSFPDSRDIAPPTWNASYAHVKLFAVQMAGAAAPLRNFLPVTPASQCSWNHDKANASTFPCQRWLPSTPHTNGIFSAVCLLTALEIGRRHTGTRPVGLVYSAFGGTSISLWAPPADFAGCPGAAAAAAGGGKDGGQTGQTPPGGLFNAMIAPLARYSLRSFLWFQGENDVASEAATPGWYACRHERLIAAWRRDWGMGDVAFNFVQLGPIAGGGPPYGLVRVAQAQALPRPGGGGADITGMAAAWDLGDASSPFDSVHFRNKTEVARRLAAAVLRTQFALPNASLAPPAVAGFSSVTAAGATIDLVVPDGAGVRLADAGQCTACCAAARDLVQLSADGGKSWVNTSLAVDATGTHVVATATAPAAAPFTHARLAWTSYPQCALVGNGNGFPLPAFLLALVPPPAEAAAEQAPPPGAAIVAARGGALEWKGRRFTWDGNTPPPPMGVNTWNAFHTNIDENIVLALADAMVKLGLRDLGWSHVNIDDGWQIARMDNGTIIEDPARFPSGMRALAAGVHQRALRFGLYTSATSLTCQLRPGSYTFEAVDIARYCEFGLDFIKVDLCSGSRWPVANESWIRMRAAIEACVAGGGRRQTLSVEYCRAGGNVPCAAAAGGGGGGGGQQLAASSCQARAADGCESWIAGVADMWRTTGDVQANWASISANLDGNNAVVAAARPGKYCDPDMLVLGQPGVSLAEARTQFGAWAVVAAPLLLSVDLTRADLDPALLAIVSNAEVIAVSQDAAQVMGVRVSPPAPDGGECWARPLADGGVAALLINRAASAGSVNCTWAQLGLAPGPAAVRDLWAKSDLGNFSDTFTSNSLAPHASTLVKVVQATRGGARA